MSIAFLVKVNGGAYLEFVSVMKKTYSGVVTTIGNVEGFPGIEDVMENLRLYGIKKVALKPFMVVAGDHSMNDMDSDEEDSWKTILVKNGFEVVTVIEELGEKDDFVNVFVNHAIEVAEDAGIDLK